MFAAAPHARRATSTSADWQSISMGLIALLITIGTLFSSERLTWHRHAATSRWISRSITCAALPSGKSPPTCTMLRRFSVYIARRLSAEMAWQRALTSCARAAHRISERVALRTHALGRHASIEAHLIAGKLDERRD